MIEFVHRPVEREKASVTSSNNLRWYKSQNRAYPSVTSVLSATKDNTDLRKWQMSVGIDKASKIAADAAKRGTAVHQLAENYLNNEHNTSGVEPDYLKLFNQIKLHLNKLDNIRGVELTLFSDELLLAGTADCIAEYKGELSVIDFKTSSSADNSKKVEDYFLQTTAYSLMYEELYKEQPEQIVIIIASEKQLVPTVYCKNRHDYILPLVNRVNAFYADFERKYG